MEWFCWWMSCSDRDLLFGFETKGDRSDLTWASQVFFCVSIPVLCTHCGCRFIDVDYNVKQVQIEEHTSLFSPSLVGLLGYFAEMHRAVFNMVPSSSVDVIWHLSLWDVGVKAASVMSPSDFCFPAFSPFLFPAFIRLSPRITSLHVLHQPNRGVRTQSVSSHVLTQLPIKRLILNETANVLWFT